MPHYLAAILYTMLLTSSVINKAASGATVTPTGRHIFFFVLNNESYKEMKIQTYSMIHVV
ncbi:MAG: hypothetical protein H7223_12285 [Pedobacter sp.]|nr:hypothetical protein [Pedobacter sp.]